MNRELLETQWPQIREILREKFNNLTEEDIRQINGRYDQLVAKLQQKYGYSREEAEDRIRSWNFDRLAGSRGSAIRDDYREAYREDKVRKSEDNTFLKWLLGLGIPLLLIGAYFLGTARNPETFTSSPSVVQQQQIFAETPADRVISNNLINALVSQQNMSASDLRNIQISTRNGVITLSGTVPNAGIRDNILDTAQNISGVRQVINNLRIG